MGGGFGSILVRKTSMGLVAKPFLEQVQTSNQHCFKKLLAASLRWPGSCYKVCPTLLRHLPRALLPGSLVGLSVLGSLVHSQGLGGNGAHYISSLNITPFKGGTLSIECCLQNEVNKRTHRETWNTPHTSPSYGLLVFVCLFAPYQDRPNRQVGQATGSQPLP